MTSELVVPPRIAQLDVYAHPEEMGKAQAMLRAFIELAAQMKEWEALTQAARVQVQQQQEFCCWWTDHITKLHGAGRGNKKSADLGTFSMRDAEKETGIKNQEVARWRTLLGNIDLYLTKIELAARRKAGHEPNENYLALGTGDNEWFTPEQYIALARSVMGGIDLDPATHAKAQKFIKAGKFFTRAEDGLQQEWHGRVWMNPPYATKEIRAFIHKLVEEIRAKRVSQAITLTHSYTDTDWFHHLEANADWICFTRGRVRFIDDAGLQSAPTQGQAFFYYGDQSGGNRFKELFGPVGFIR